MTESAWGLKGLLQAAYSAGVDGRLVTLCRRQQSKQQEIGGLERSHGQIRQLVLTLQNVLPDQCAQTVNSKP